MKKFSLMLTLLLTQVSAYGQTQLKLMESWSGFSAPDILSSSYTNQLQSLPLAANLEDGKHFWSGDYWASAKGSINYRWYSSKNGFGYRSPGLDRLKTMSQEELKDLSPSEKFDVLMGRYDYPLKNDADRGASPRAPIWQGLCHGWAPASLHHAEPKPKTLRNPDGILVPFGSADIKALVSYYYAFIDTDATGQMGLRCFFGGWLGGVKGCDQDLNAGAFHIVIANELGLKRKGVLMDVDRYRQVWNQPIVGYKSEILHSNLSPSLGAASGTVREMRVATELFYVDEVDPTWEPVIGTNLQKISKRDLLYRIELDSTGKIIGGEWEGWDRPDFLWNKLKTSKFNGLLSGLEKLLDD